MNGEFRRVSDMFISFVEFMSEFGRKEVEEKTMHSVFFQYACFSLARERGEAWSVDEGKSQKKGRRARPLFSVMFLWSERTKLAEKVLLFFLAHFGSE